MVKGAAGLASNESAASPPLGDVLEFLRLIWAVDHGLQATSRRMAVSLGVTGQQRLVIRMIGRFPGISARRLAELLYLHPSTLTGALKLLEHRGLLSRRPDPRDGRRAALGLTEKGRKSDVDAGGTVELVVQQALSGLPRGKVLATQEVLCLLAEALGAHSKLRRRIRP